MRRPTFTDVLLAQKQIRPFLLRTPLHSYPAIDELVGTRVFIKHENYQPIGAFKVRGGMVYMAALKRIPAGRAALLGLLELVLGPIWVWIVDGEKPGDLTLLGGLIVIGSAAANVWLDSRQSTG